MNGIEKITERIAADTKAEIEAIAAASDAQVAEINARWSEKTEAEYTAALEQGKKDADYRVERMGGVAQLEARKLKLSAKQEMLDKAFAAAQEKLVSLSDDEYVALLAKLAADNVSTGRETLVFSVADRPRCGKRVVIAANALLEQAGRAAELTLSEESREFAGGLYIKDGNIENNCTFPTILRILREKMAAEVATILFD